MKRQRLLMVAVVAAFSTVMASCAVFPGVSIPQSIPLSGSWSGLLVDGQYLVNLSGAFSSAGGLKIEFDSTAGVNPDHVYYQIRYNGGASEVSGTMTGPNGFHFEHVFTYPFQTGEHVAVSLWTECGRTEDCTAWLASSRTYNYRLSIVP